MQRKLALLVLSLAILALALWVALSRGTSPALSVTNAPATSEKEKTAATVAVGPAETLPETRTEASTPTAQASRLHVRSSAGIPLAFVEVELEGAWKRHQLLNGCVNDLVEKLPTRVRAPGHVIRALESIESELVLEPDALLLIERPHLRSCLAELVVEEGMCRESSEFLEARTRAVVTEWISDSCFGIAVACDRLEPLSSELRMNLVRADRQRSFLALLAKSGMRDRWQMPCEGTRAGSPLEVRVERPAGLRGPLTVVLDCPAEPGSGRPMRYFPWGGVGDVSSDQSEELTLAATEDVVRFPFALVGRQLSVGAFDTASHAYGRIEFVHDGDWRTLELRPALEFRGRVVEAESRKPLRSVYLLFQGVHSPGWVIEAQELKLDESGRFVLNGPTRPIVNRGVSLDPPDSFSVTAHAPGFDHLALTIERTDPRVLDVGEMALVRHKNPIALAPGHGLEPNQVDGQSLVFADKPQELWLTIPAVALDDGRLELEFRASSPSDPGMSVARRQDVLLGTDFNVSFERPLGEILFVHVVDDVRSFRLESDGLYHRLPEQQLALTLRTEKLAAGDKDWVIGWTWNGAWSRVGMIASRVPGEERDVRVTIPAGAQQLWWSSSGIPPDLHGDPGGFQAITGSSMKVVLR